MTRLSLEVRWWIGVLLALQVLMSFGGIGLLSRVSPAVDRILRENEFTVEAVESMLAALASTSDPLPQASRDLFEQGLARAQANVTEEEERPLLATIAASAPAVLDGDPSGRAPLIAALRALSEVNRASMREADNDAQRMSGGGAWAAAFAGMTGFALGVLVLNRLLTRLVVPVLQVDATLESARRGDPHRRCVQLLGPNELCRIGENVNWLLDERSRTPVVAGGSSTEILRAVLLVHLDQDPRPVVVVGSEGLLAMNAAAYAASGEVPSPAEVAAAVRQGLPVPDGWEATKLLAGNAWSCRRTT